jgi:hypothetical protein
MFDKLQKINPLVAAFCLGKIVKNGQTLYRNVYFDDLTEKLETYPVDELGQTYSMQTHGAIQSKDNGFSIVGIDSEFTCPMGYQGVNCEAIPICSVDDAQGLKKRITYSQFHAMNLYLSVQDSSLLSSFSTEVTHPKLYAICDGKGFYTLEACGKNQILDDSQIACVNYDFCKDMLNGYKYREDDLEKDQYYMCVNGIKELQTCSPNYVFSTAVGNCIRETKCSGNDGYQEKISDTSYMQCENDQEVLHTCPDGLYMDAETQHMSCLDINCKTFDVNLESDYFDVVIQHNVCQSNIQTQTTCDSTLVPWQKIIHWNGQNTVSLPAYPKQQYLGISCIDVVNPSKILKTDAMCDLRLPLMQTSHPYSLTEQKYRCTDTKYTNDYERGELWDNNAKTSVDIFPVNVAVPCIDVSFDLSLPGKFSVLTQLDDTYFSFLTYPFYFINDDTYWPSKETFKTPRCQDDTITLEEYNSQDFRRSHVFLGFTTSLNTIYCFVQGETMNNIPENMTAVSSTPYNSIQKNALTKSGDVGFLSFQVTEEIELYASGTTKISISATQLTITVDKIETKLDPNIYFIALTDDGKIAMNPSLNLPSINWDLKTPISYTNVSSAK